MTFLSRLFDALTRPSTQENPPSTPKPRTPASATHFTVIDLETTGFCGKNDRVVEVALVRVDREGKILHEFETLVNPMRDIGNSFIHGIEARHVAKAPQFADIAGDILEIMNGSVLVAHNVPFELKMLCGEFQRLNYSFPECKWVCTMSTAHKYAPGAPRKLGALCYQLGIPLDNAHCAMSDARATAQLLRHCLECLEEDLSLPLPPVAHSFPTGCRCVNRGEANSPCSGHSLMERLTSVLPSHPTEGHLDSYFETLDRVFADSILEESEAQELAELAQDLGLSLSQVEEAHQTYLNEIVSVANKDGYVSEMEKDHIKAISSALGVKANSSLDALERLNLYPRDLAGKSVCFTGTPRGTIDGKPIDKQTMTTKAEEFGMVVKNGISKKVDLLVARDTFTNSGKGRKAREYGIPVISEQVFWNWLGVQVR